MVLIGFVFFIVMFNGFVGGYYWVINGDNICGGIF